MLASPKQNYLLAALPPEDYARFSSTLRPVKLPLGHTLYQSDGLIDHVYFPVTAVVSLVAELPNGDSTEIAITGNEGMLGTALIMGGDRSHNQAVTQCAGHAYRASAPRLHKEVRENTALRNLILHFTLAQSKQIDQTVACNRHHPVVQQLCRWLLLSLDRLPSNVVLMTDGLVANMLGVRLRGVMSAAGQLEKEGIITYYRGRITVLDRVKLEKRTCACYKIVRDEERRLLPQRSTRMN